MKAILFDFGNTLLSTRLDWGRILPAGLAELARTLRLRFALDGRRLGRDFLFFRHVGRRRAERDLIETPAVEALRQALALQGLVAPDPEVLQSGVDGFFSAEQASYPIILGIPETIARLKEAGFKLAVVTNATCGQLIRRALKSRGLLGYFDHVAVSAEVGCCKPDPAIFWKAMHALEVQADECSMVGDRTDTDIEGARRAGMRAVLTDFFGDRASLTPDDPQPDALVRTPQELTSLFRSWELSPPQSPTS